MTVAPAHAPAPAGESPVVSRTLAQWLDRLEGLHPAEIELGLERVGEVAARMGVDRPDVPVFTVAGTNGKGSVCALLEAVLTADGHRVACYTSPHLKRFNERIRVAGREIADDELCRAFTAVEAARGEVPLTAFEFGTLAALEHFRAAGPDVLVLEVGLGGRLDATNVIAADVAVVTSVDLDHAEWLGSDLDGIAREKAGIARAGRPLICGAAAPPAGLRSMVDERGAELVARGVAFDARRSANGETWHWTGRDRSCSDLPLPALIGGYPLDNAACALAALDAAGLLPGHAALAAGLRATAVAGRFELRSLDGVEVILDVAHNPAAAAALATALAARPCSGRTLGVLGMYRDKDAEGVVAALAESVDVWFPVGLVGPRGRDCDSLAALVRDAGARVAAAAANPVAGGRAAREAAQAGDRIVILGSFATVAEADALFL